MTPVAPHTGFYVGVVLLILVVAAWGRYIEHRFRNCKCDRKPTLLRPRWKKIDHRDDHDRYEGDS